MLFLKEDVSFESAKEFLLWFFCKERGTPETYIDKECENIQCQARAGRTFVDLWRIYQGLMLIRLTAPEVLEEEFATELLKLTLDKKIDGLYCMDIRKFTFHTTEKGYTNQIADLKEYFEWKVDWVELKGGHDSMMKFLLRTKKMSIINDKVILNITY